MTGFTPETEACLACHPSQKDAEPMTDKTVDEAVERVKAYVASWDGFDDGTIISDNCDPNDLILSDLRALLSALELGRHLAKDALPGGETHPCVDEAILERMARAHDKEDAAQKGDPDPWDHFNCDAGEVSEAACADCRSFRIDRLACMLRAWEALSASTTDSGKGKLDAEADGWRPIESHGGDCLPILVGRARPARGSSVLAAFMDATGVWRVLGSYAGMDVLPYEPSHWMPLPPAPPTGEGGGS